MTTSHICIMIAIIVYLGAMIYVGYLCSKKNNDTSDFYLGGRKLGPLVTAMSAEASDMSSWLLMGLPGLAYLSGIADAGWTAIGLAIGMGFIGYAVLFAIILGGAMFICSLTGFGGGRDEERALKITVPENLDYTEAFDEILADCTDSYRLTNVKTTNMGSLFKLTYVVKLKKDTNQKDMIDRLRVRNGNLEIMLTQVDSGDMTL